MPPINIPRACPRESGGAGLADASSALDVPLHPDLGLLAQRRRELLLQDDPPTHPPRGIPLDRRPADRYQCLSRRAQCQPQTIVWTKSADAILAKLDRCPVSHV